MGVAPWLRRNGTAMALVPALLLVVVGTVIVRAGSQPRRASSATAEHAIPSNFGRPSGLPLPSQTPLPEYETRLFEFVNARRYAELGWLRDKGVRDTGPFINGTYFGTHPAVRVYYSPGVVRWLMAGRVGTIPDGEMIVKEQFA